VVAVTAQAMPDDVKRVLAAGFDGYIAKPLDLARFDELLQRMLDASEPEAPPPPA
jgi:CheY-like chemotaxis protein